MRKIALITIWIASLLLTVVCSAAAEEVRIYQPGTSPWSFEIPESLMETELPEGSVESGMVAYLADPGTGLCIEIYQYSKEDKPDTLEAFVEQDAAQYGGTKVVPVGECWGLTAGWYDITDPEGQYTIEYLFLEEEAGYLVIGYTMNSDDAADEILAILKTLKRR